MDRMPLTRVRETRVLAGVCAGVARHLELPVAAVRIGCVVFGALGGAGALFYLWLWATVPAEGETEGVVPFKRMLTLPTQGPLDAVSRPERERSAPAADAAPERPTQPRADGPRPVPGRRWPIAELLLGACLLIAGCGLALDLLGWHINLAILLPGLAVLVGVGLTWWLIADRHRPERHQIPRVLGALALVAVGVLMFFVTAREPSVWTVAAAAVAVLVGVALALAPWLLRLNRELIAERAARAREAERAEIAAHLHDSVLQTLAMIQQRSAPGSDVSRLARRQERDLREWLFRGADGAERADGATPADAADGVLRAHAETLEGSHAVRFEFVTVGERAASAVPEAIVAAAREAMLNAARHAGGAVTVYIEATQEAVAIDVTDRGPGLSLTVIPDGRMGVRESIIGRMERAGGTARVVPGPGGGTSVRLRIAREAPTAGAQANHTTKGHAGD